MAICIYKKPDGTRCDRPVSKNSLYCPEHRPSALMAEKGWAVDVTGKLRKDDTGLDTLVAREPPRGTKGRA